MDVAEHENEPVVWHWVAAVCGVTVLVSQLFLERGGNSYIRAAGIAGLLASGVFIFPPFLLLARYRGRSPGEPYYRTTTIVDRGVYSIVRHPQYVGYVLLVLGFAALTQHAIIWVLAACSAGGFYCQSLKEEGLCRERSGEEYLEYMRRVPRFNFPAGLCRYLARRTCRG